MPAATAPKPLDSSTVHLISTHSEYLRLKGEGNLVEGHDEVKGKFIHAVIGETVEVLRSCGILLASAARLEELDKVLMARAPDSDGDIIIGPEDASEYSAVIRTHCSAWTDFLGENYFADTRPRQGVFDYSRLGKLGGSSVLFQDEALLGRLPADVKSDMDLAATALTRGVVNGSVLLALRAGEAMVRQVYRLHLEKDPDPLANWYDLAEEVFPKLTSLKLQDRDELKGYVNGLRLTRNRAMHPGARFGVRDAEDTIVAVRQLVVRLDGLPKTTPGVS